MEVVLEGVVSEREILLQAVAPAALQVVVHDLALGEDVLGGGECELGGFECQCLACRAALQGGFELG